MQKTLVKTHSRVSQRKIQGGLTPSEGHGAVLRHGAPERRCEVRHGGGPREGPGRLVELCGWVIGLSTARGADSGESEACDTHKHTCAPKETLGTWTVDKTVNHGDK